MKNNTEAFIWNRQFTFEQFRKFNKIQRMRRGLDIKTREQAMFARCQLVDTEKRYNVSHSFDGKWEGKPAYFTPEIRPLFMDYAVAVYKQTLAEARQRFPGFAAYAIEDGAMVGERRINFPQKLDLATSQWMHSRFWHLANSDEIKVPESFRAYWKNDGGTVGGRKEVVLEISLDRPVVNIKSWEEIRDCIGKGEKLPIDLKPRSCDAKAALELLTEVSLTELYPLNWDVVKKPLTPVNEALFSALQQYDVAAVREALVAGADPNGLGKYDDVPLQIAVNFTWAENRPYTTDEQYIKDRLTLGPFVQQKIEMINLLVEFGAQVNWAGLNETTPLAVACLNSTSEIVTHLLDLGADPSIVCYDDEHPSDMGSAWDSAAYMGDRNIDHEDDTLWDALEARYPKPGAGVFDKIACLP